MESVSLSKIINDVRVILDQNRDDYTQLNVGEYTLELNEVIVKGVIPAAQWAHMNAPISKLKGVAFPDTGTIGNALQLPDDFMRLVSVRVSNWKRALNSYYAEDDPYVSQILSGYAGLMPTYNKPAMVLRQGDDRHLLLYPYADDESSDSDESTATEDDCVEYAYYIPLPQIEGLDESSDDESSDDNPYDNATIDLEPAVYQAFLYYLAYLTKLTYNEDNKFAERAQALL